MAEFLTTIGVCDRLERIIEEAEEKLVLVSPYVQFSPTFLERLKGAERRGVKITLIYGKEELKTGERDKLNDVRRLSLRFYPNLHAKCYYNEKQMIITSMNLYDFSERTNREMGVLVHKDADSSIYNAAVKEVESIRDSSEDKRRSSLAGMGKAFMSVANALVDEIDGASTSRKGFCIRCSRRIDLNSDKPLCVECYGKWSAHKNPTYGEHCCHGCGKTTKTSMSRPLCRDCYKKG